MQVAPYPNSQNPPDPKAAQNPLSGSRKRDGRYLDHHLLLVRSVFEGHRPPGCSWSQALRSRGDALNPQWRRSVKRGKESADVRHRYRSWRLRLLGPERVLGETGRPTAIEMDEYAPPLPSAELCGHRRYLSDTEAPQRDRCESHPYEARCQGRFVTRGKPGGLGSLYGLGSGRARTLIMPFS